MNSECIERSKYQGCLICREAETVRFLLDTLRCKTNMEITPSSRCMLIFVAERITAIMIALRLRRVCDRQEPYLRKPRNQAGTALNAAASICCQALPFRSCCYRMSIKPPTSDSILTPSATLAVTDIMQRCNPAVHAMVHLPVFLVVRAKMIVSQVRKEGRVCCWVHVDI